ncbi:MAG: hypothetical protein ACTSQF_01915 [Candidatus Heimdallarchaeaceae archaeon]
MKSKIMKLKNIINYVLLASILAFGFSCEEKEGIECWGCTETTRLVLTDPPIVFTLSSEVDTLCGICESEIRFYENEKSYSDSIVGDQHYFNEMKCEKIK